MYRKTPSTKYSAESTPLPQRWRRRPKWRPIQISSRVYASALSPVVETAPSFRAGRTPRPPAPNTCAAGLSRGGNRPPPSAPRSGESSHRRPGRQSGHQPGQDTACPARFRLSRRGRKSLRHKQEPPRLLGTLHHPLPQSGRGRSNYRFDSCAFESPPGRGVFIRAPRRPVVPLSANFLSPSAIHRVFETGCKRHPLCNNIDIGSPQPLSWPSTGGPQCAPYQLLA